MYIDTHCHLDFPEFDADRQQVINKAAETGVERIVNIGTDVETSEKSAELASRYSSILPTAGVHPSHVKGVSLSCMKRIDELAAGGGFAGIGETGLDYHYGRGEEEKQKDFFRAHIDIAFKYGLPLIVHQRESRDDVMEILEKSSVPGRVVFHCFGGDRTLAGYCSDKGFYISFTGILTFKNAKEARKVCEEYPLLKIMAETDAPFLSPEPHRGKRNDPSKVVRVVEAIAGIKGMDVEECANIILDNSRKFFGI